MSQLPDEVRWVLQAREGSEQAVTLLVNTHAASLVRYLNCIIHDEAAAEEIAQLAFVRAFKKLERLHEPTAFRNWLWKIGRCAALDFRRTLDRGGGASVENVSTESLDKTPADTVSADLFWQRESVIDSTRRVIEELPKASRELLLLRYREGLTLEEISERMDLPRTTIKARLARLRGALRPRLDSLAREWRRLLDELP